MGDVIDSKVDNELGISPPLTNLSLPKKGQLKKITKQNQENKNKMVKKLKKIRFSPAKVEPQTLDLYGQRVIYCATTTNVTDNG